jgi:hypothetical protein
VPKRRDMPKAFLASLVIHALLVLVTWNLDLFGDAAKEAGAAAPQRGDIVEMFLVPDDVPGVDLDRPTAFTNVPDRHEVEEPPSRADFLAGVNSRAADLLEGGTEDALPGTEHQGDFSQVAILRHEGGAPSGGVTTMQPTPALDEGHDGEEDLGASERPGSPADDIRDEGLVREGDDAEDDGESPGALRGGQQASELAEFPEPSPPSIVDVERQGQSGDPRFAHDQQDVSTGGNMIQFGEYNLNTIAWDFAPWLEQFERDFRPHWIPPYAYRLGVVDGRTILRLVVEPDGTIGSLEVIESYGHDSLHQASTAALRGSAPFAPLPKDFPEEHLVLEMGLHYPAWK